MSPRLRVLAGPSPASMVPISVNSDSPHTITSDAFVGQVLAYIKDFTDSEDKIMENEYFDKVERKGVTWSIQVQGRFLEPHSADDILFGNTFDRPLKLPWGSGAALKLMKYMDPTLEHDLGSQTEPWALSPLISTMPYFSHTRSAPPPFPPPTPLADDTSQLHLAKTSEPYSSSSSASSSSSLGSAESLTTGKEKKKSKHTRTKDGKKILSLPTPSDRRTYFTQASRREEIIFGAEDVITADFCYGYIEFSPSLSLRLPGGISLDLMRYWDGQQVRFVCCDRKSEDGHPYGKIFWCVAIELLKEAESMEGNNEDMDKDEVNDID